MLSLLTSTLSALPICYMIVATDAPNVQAVVKHEMAHCWGWVHPTNIAGGKSINKQYRAFVPPLKYRLKGKYPNMGEGIRFELSQDVLKLCDGGSAYGCQWGGLQNNK